MYISALTTISFKHIHIFLAPVGIKIHKNTIFCLGSDYQTFGLSEFWTIGPSDYRTLGILDRMIHVITETHHVH
jgi:hypothetical protein